MREATHAINAGSHLLLRGLRACGVPLCDSTVGGAIARKLDSAMGFLTFSMAMGTSMTAAEASVHKTSNGRVTPVLALHWHSTGTALLLDWHFTRSVVVRVVLVQCRCSTIIATL